MFVSLIAFYITFLAGNVSTDKVKHCRNIATAIHYFTLATMAWMTVEAVHMYFMFVKLYQRTIPVKHFIPVSCVLAYGT